MTSRGLNEGDFKQIAALLDRTLKVCKHVQEQKGKQLKDFIMCASGLAQGKDQEKEEMGYSYAEFQSHVSCLSAVSEPGSVLSRLRCAARC